MVVEIIAEVLSISEPAARFIFGLLLTYPQAFIYRPLIIPYYLCCWWVCFATVCFRLVCFFAFYVDVILVYCVFLLFGKGKVSLLLTWIITMGHLTFGYVIVISSNQVHPIFWTILHCVLVLKLIGLAHDLYDGTKSKSLLSDEQKERCLAELPSFIEYFGYSYFFANILSGPQISYIRYKHFISSILFDFKTTPSSLLPGL
ncbi:PREDICTED: lysophospholipid acyltransferase 5-like [Amphimedon queenslandica]|uniref:Lysophospholipid acyltransferase 5 n=2 Tax=Amphimedon queenslandica TaxID=400682 RepID=A0AAN0IQ79_AMPQE|nr:PREDICTED: lysophospholipid acyltransferase 5-like [Amphimedon queenslandica]|eukprot:XP_011407242.1 PREDICTED: lysophospholipid acyltransferase 5-like [Amphimedon queenslandica]